MVIKVLIFMTLAVMLISLFWGLSFLGKDDSKSKRLVKSLTFRVSAAAVLLILIVIGILTGALQPHGIGPQTTSMQKDVDKN